MQPETDRPPTRPPAPRGEPVAIDLARILEGDADGITVFDASWRYRYVNAAAERMAGRGRNEMLGRSILELWPQAQGASFFDAMRRAVREQAVTVATYPSIVHPGVWVEARCVPLGDGPADGDGAVLAVHWREVTEGRQAEEQLGRSLSLLNAVVEGVAETGGIVAAVDREHRFLLANRAGVRFLGAESEADVLGKTDAEWFRRASGDPALEAVRRQVWEMDEALMRAGEARTVEFEAAATPTGDGPRSFVSAKAPLRDPETGEVVGLVNVVHDVTAGRRAGRRLRRLFDSSVVGVIFWNLDTSKITDANDHFLRMVGYTRGDLEAGRLDFRAMTPPEWTERNERGVADIRTHGFAHAYEKEYFRKDGTRVPILIGGSRFEDSAAEGFSYVIDISDRKAAERERAEAVRRDRERERNIARQLQDALQPPAPDAIPGLALAAHYHAALGEAEVGGDFHDTLDLGAGRHALVVADLSGKGLAAASQVAMVRNQLRYALYTADLAEPGALATAVERLNSVLARRDLLAGFATLFVGVWDAAAGKLTYVNAGQEPALAWRAATGDVEMLPPTGPVLGGFEGGRFAERSVTLGPGDIWTAFTDGLTEAGPSRKDLLGIEGVTPRFAAACTGAGGTTDARGRGAPADILRRLVAAVEAFTGSAGLRDDVCALLGVRAPEEPRPRPALPGITDVGRFVKETEIRDAGAASASRLQPLTAALLGCVTPAEVIAAVVERGAAVLGAEAGLVALLRGDRLEIAGSRGYAPEVMAAWGTFPVNASLPLSDAVREGAPRFSEARADMEARYPEMFRRGPTHAVKASASLPLSARGRTLGGLHVSFPEERAFTEADRAFLLELARQCALALDRALLLEEIEGARRRQEFLAGASALLAESLDYQKTLDAVAHLAVPDLCDWAAVDMLDSSGHDSGRVLNLAVAHADPDEVRWVREAQRRYPVDLSQTGQPIVQAIRTGETVFLPDIPEEVLLAAARDEEHLRLIRRLDLRSYVCVPLTARGKTFGAVTFASSRSSGRMFTPEMLGLAEELARRAAVAVDNARLFGTAESARQQTAAVLESIGEMFYAVDAEFRFTYVNRRAEEVWGVRREGLIGRSLWEVFPQMRGSDSYRAQVEAMRGRRTVRYETVSPVLRRWIECSVYPAADGGIAVYFRDIQEQKEAEEAIRASEERYRRLLDTALEGVLFLDADGNIASVNAQFARMLGYGSPAELAGRSLFDLFFEDDAWRARDRWAARLAGVEEEYELRLRRRDGGECWAIAHVSVERDAAGAFVGTFTMLTDITERRRALNALRTKSDEVTSILESVTDAFFALDADWRFTYVNHEAERVLLRERGELIGKNLWEEFPAAVGSDFETYYRRAVRERETVAFQAHYPAPLDTWYDVRAYPSPSGGGLSVYFRSVNEERRREQERDRLLAELREASVRQRRFLKEMLAGFTEGRLRLCYTASELPEPLAPLAEPVSLTGDTLRLLRKRVEAVVEALKMPKERANDFLTAVHEAAMNAVKYGGGGEARVHGDRESGAVQVWVADRGPGIAEDMIHRAVEPGFTTGGFGQGMFFMHSCADRLYLLSEDGKGTTVVLEMDRAAPEPAWLRARG